MNAVIDIGNSRIKLALFEGNEIKAEHTAQDNSLCQALAWLSSYSVDSIILSCVIDMTAEQEAALQALLTPVMRFTSSTPIPLVNAYLTPQTLGVDRLAAAVGAWQCSPGNPLLVIDAGSCITFDMVSADGIYLGGNIAPGLHMRLQAIGDYVPRLPVVDAEGDLPELGYDTATAIRSGVVQGIRREIDGYISHIVSRHPSLRVFLTGGDAPLLSSALPSAVTTDRHLVERGLNAILNYNKDSIHI